MRPLQSAKRSIGPAHVALAVSLAIYVALRILAFERGVGLMGDSPTYESTEAAPFLSSSFWAGGRAFSVPLLWKIVPGGREADVVSQLLISIACWWFLAWTFARRVPWAGLRIVALWSVLGLSLVNEVTLWDNALMSESLSLSLLALATGLALRSADGPGVHDWALVAVLALWSFTRDTNAYYAVVALPVLALLVWRARGRRRRVAVMLGLCATILVGAAASAQLGGRSTSPVADVVAVRLPKDAPDAIRWLASHGASGPYDPRAPTVYRDYLLTHPLFSLGGPLRDRPTYGAFSSADRLVALYTPRVGDFYDFHQARWRVPRILQRVYMPSSPLALGGYLVIAAGLLFVLRIGLGAFPARTRSVWLVGGVLLASAYAMTVVAWNYDSQEIDRHALTSAVAIRLAFVLVVVETAIAIVERLGPRRLRPVETGTDAAEERASVGPSGPTE